MIFTDFDLKWTRNLPVGDNQGLATTRAQKMESADYYDEAGQIFTTVFHKYNERISPVKKYPSPVFVNLELNLVHVRDFDEKKNEIESIIDLRINWLDARLFWYAYSIKHITVNISTVWSPDVPFINAVTAPEVLINPRYLVVNSTGDVFWYRRLRTRTTCDPGSNDTRICSFKFGSRQMMAHQQDFGNDVTCGISENYDDSMWTAEEMTTERHIRPAYYSPFSGNISEVHCVFNVSWLGVTSGFSSKYNLYTYIATMSTLLTILGMSKIDF